MKKEYVLTHPAFLIHASFIFETEKKNMIFMAEHKALHRTQSLLLPVTPQRQAESPIAEATYMNSLLTDTYSGNTRTISLY